MIPTDPPSKHCICDCPHDNEERHCYSRMGEENGEQDGPEGENCDDNDDDCYCVEPYKSWLFDYGFTNSRNSYNECCGLEG